MNCMCKMSCDCRCKVEKKLIENIWENIESFENQEIWKQFVDNDPEMVLLKDKIKNIVYIRIPSLQQTRCYIISTMMINLMKEVKIDSTVIFETIKLVEENPLKITIQYFQNLILMIVMKFYQTLSTKFVIKFSNMTWFEYQESMMSLEYNTNEKDKIKYILIDDLDFENGLYTPKFYQENDNFDKTQYENYLSTIFMEDLDISSRYSLKSENIIKVSGNELVDIECEFLSEGASLANLVGFFFFEEHNPPQHASDIKNRYILIPHANYKSGIQNGFKFSIPSRIILEKEITQVEEFHYENLYQGKVSSFQHQPQTCIGFFLIKDGFNRLNNLLDFDPSFSISNINVDENVQTFGFKNHLNESLILAFEDINTENLSNKDFNDCIISIKSSKPNTLNFIDYNDNNNASNLNETLPIVQNGTILFSDRPSVCDFKSIYIQYHTKSWIEQGRIKKLHLQFSFLRIDDLDIDHRFGIKLANIHLDPNARIKRTIIIDDKIHNSDSKDSLINNDEIILLQSSKGQSKSALYNSDQSWAQYEEDENEEYQDPVFRTNVSVWITCDIPVDYSSKSGFPFAIFADTFLSGNTNSGTPFRYVANKHYMVEDSYFYINNVNKIPRLINIQNNPNFKYSLPSSNKIYETFPNFIHQFTKNDIHWWRNVSSENISTKTIQTHQNVQTDFNLNKPNWF